MRCAIVDGSERRGLGLAASWLKWECRRAGIEVVDGNSDVALLTSPVPAVAAARRLKKAGKFVVAGGSSCPAAYGQDIDIACVGDGSRFVRTLAAGGIDAAAALPESWVPGDARLVVPFDGFPFDCPPIRFQDGAVRLFESAGCRSKCLFCQTGWGRRYAENPKVGSIPIVARRLMAAGERVIVVCNDGAASDAVMSIQQKHVSARASSIARCDVSTLPKHVRIGVEGVSERLRSAVGKPISHERLLRLTLELGRAGKSVRWFMIAGLPGESDDDWGEFRGLLSELRAARGELVKGMIQVSFTAFVPSPAAPLSVIPLDDSYWDRWTSMIDWWDRGSGFSRGVWMMRPKAPKSRMKDALSLIGCSEQELRRGWWHDEQPNWRIRYPYADLRTMRKIAAKYCRAVGLSVPHGF